MFDKKVLGENIKEGRERVGLTQNQLAKELFVTFQAVSNWERGVTPPEIENICKIAELLGTSVDELLFKSQKGNKYMIAIDGGGTKTDFVLFTEEGNVLKSAILSDSNPNSVGTENCCNILLHGIDLLGVKHYNVCSIFAGIAGGINSGAAAIIAKKLSERYPNSTVICSGDILNVLGFAPDPMNAMGIICGTGSSIFIRTNGELETVGGWGYLFEEGGSGFSIGRDAIRETLDVYEGIKKENVLSQQITAELGNIKINLGELYKMGVRGVASLAPFVFRAAETGDRTALAILNRNAECMAKYITAGQKKREYKGEIYGGGGLLTNEIYRKILQEKIDAEIIIPTLPPIYGAAVECCLQNNIELPTDFYKNFESSYKRRKRENA